MSSMASAAGRDLGRRKCQVPRTNWTPSSSQPFATSCWARSMAIGSSGAPSCSASRSHPDSGNVTGMGGTCAVDFGSSTGLSAVVV